MDETQKVFDANCICPQFEDNPRMPRRDVVLTGLIAFGAGVAVGVNWKKLGKEAAPLLEKLGLKMSDLADFLATVTEEKATSQAKPKSSRSRSKKSKAPTKASSPAMVHRNGNGTHVASVGSSAKRKTTRSKPVILAETVSQ